MKILEWFRDRAVRRIVKFGLPVAIGRFLQAFAGLIQLSLLAHHLGPGPVGVIALVRTVATAVESYANFNTWHAILKYGTEAIANGRPRDVDRVIKLSFVIDLVTAALGALVMVGLAFAIPSAFGWTSHEAMLCALYSLTILTRVFGTLDGIYRICDAYRAQAITGTVAAFVMTGAVAIAVAVGAGLEGCVVALVLGEVFANVVLLAVALFVARENGYGNWFRSSLRGVRTTFPGILRFLLATNGQLTLKKTQGDADMFVVGAMLGKVPSGLYRVVKQLGLIPGKLFMPFEQVLFTELARASAAGDYVAFRRLLLRFAGIVTLGSIAIWIAVSIFAEPLIRVVAGDGFLGAVDPFRWYMLAIVLTVANTPVQRAMIALGRPGTLFFFDLVTLVILIVAVIAGAYWGGLVGVSQAVVLHKVVQTVWSTWFVDRLTRTRRAEAATAPAA